ncbi:hypothetical protein MACH17_05190 [Phaeobacter inhibens]|nr:hypothetical protein MACH17_05190 [Phaeobacter inhibens]
MQPTQSLGNLLKLCKTSPPEALAAWAAPVRPVKPKACLRQNGWVLRFRPRTGSALMLCSTVTNFDLFCAL